MMYSCAGFLDRIKGRRDNKHCGEAETSKLKTSFCATAATVDHSGSAYVTQTSHDNNIIRNRLEWRPLAPRAPCVCVLGILGRLYDMIDVWTAYGPQTEVLVQLNTTFF